MSLSQDRKDLQRIVVLNPKGGCGKTSIATNLASYYSLRDAMPTLLDYDPQGASMRWLERRPRRSPPIHGVAAFRNSVNVTKTWQQRVPRETRQIVVDTPARFEGAQIHDLIYDASNVIIPVLPSAIDIRYAARFIAELLLMAQLDGREVHVGIVANRTRKQTRSLRQLMRFLSSLKIPVVAVIRDSQCIVTAAGRGIGVAEMPEYQGKQDRASFSQLIAWLDRWRPRQMKSDSPPIDADADEFHARPFH